MSLPHPHRPPVPALEPLFHLECRVGPVQDFGVTSAGHRRIVDLLGGTVTGALAGEVLPGGADWQIVRDDGTVEIDTRYAIRTTDGDLVHVRTRGVRSGPPGVVEALLRGEDIPPSQYYFRLVVTVETSAERHADLQRTLIVASALRSADTVVYDAYRLT